MKLYSWMEYILEITFQGCGLRKQAHPLNKRKRKRIFISLLETVQPCVEILNYMTEKWHPVWEEKEDSQKK